MSDVTRPDETRSAATKRVSQEWRDNCESPAPKIHRGKLALDQIHAEEAVFQQRDLACLSLGLSESHVGNLVEVLTRKPPSELEPIEVWWSGKRWIVIDGHHRLKAYQQVAKRRKGKRILVPAKARHCDFDEALALSLEGNSRDKLQMSAEEKSDAAWRFVCLGDGQGWTKQQISRRANRSVRTIGHMRAVRREIIEAIQKGEIEGVGIEDLPDMSWHSAKRLLEDESYSPWDDDRRREEARKMAIKIQKSLGNKPVTSPDIFGLALEMLHPNLPSQLLISEAFEDALINHETVIMKRRELIDGEHETLVEF